MTLMASTPVRYEGRDLEAMSFARRYHQWIADIFAPYLGNQVAEVGAGSGNFSSLLVGKNVQNLVAIEPSREMFPLLKQKFDGDVRVITRHALFQDMCKEYQNHFDSVVYVNVLEHIEKDDQELRSVYQSLKAGGHVCIFVPALPWLYSDFDASVGHYRRYTKRQLEQLLKETGFDIVRISYFDLIGIIPWFIFFKLFRKKLSTGDAVLYDRFVVPFVRMCESIVPIPVGKNLIVIAKKQ